MSSLLNRGGRAVMLTLPCGPPSTAASSVYAASEASADTTTTASAASFASYESTSTIGSSAFVPAFAQPDRSPLLLSPTYALDTPLPLLELQDGDTLVYLNPSKFASIACPPLRVLSSRLKSTNSPVFQQLFTPSAQQRILNRLIKQKKPQLSGGKLPSGVRYVLDLTPEDEGDKAVEWQEKLWCPDVVLQWRSNMVDLPPVFAPLEFEQQLEEFRRRQWGKGKLASGNTPITPEPYSFDRHVLNLERLIHILHGIDPLIQTTVDWYTLHCLSVAFGTTDATADYVARWIFSNSLIIESHPSLIWQVAIEAGLATIASDAFAAAVMKYTVDPKEAVSIPGGLEAAAAFVARIQKEFEDLIDVYWIDQYLPTSPPTGSIDHQKFETFRNAFRGYIVRLLVLNGGIDTLSIDTVLQRAMLRSTWLGLQTVTLSSDSSYLSPSGLDGMAYHYLVSATEAWESWDKSSSESSAQGNDDLWADLRLRAPRYVAASATQRTAMEGQEALSLADFEDAESEMISLKDSEIFYDSVKQEEMKTEIEDHLSSNVVPRFSMESTLHPSLASSSSPPKLDAEPDDKPEKTWLQDYSNERRAWLQKHYEEGVRQNLADQASSDTKVTNESDPKDTSSIDTVQPAEQTSRSSLPTSDPAAPQWLIEQLAKLSDENPPAWFWALMHHPQNDTQRPTEPRIRCLDCPDMLYFPGPGETLDNFRTHLRNAMHQNRVHSRQLSEGIKTIAKKNNPPKKSRWAWDDPEDVRDTETQKVVEIPHGLFPILRLCETYIKSKCAEMTARNIVFDPILLEDHLACLEESERVFMPLWAGGEAAPNANFSKTTVTNRGVSDSTVDEAMTINISSAGVGSVCTASTFKTDESFTELDTPEGSLGSSGSVISLEDNSDNSQSNATPSADSDEDEWIIEGDEDEDDFMDDDTLFS
ncbi:hypothetical protein ABW21_db0201481 [Orbilia brochopaga]|nr:hypothetical protein ABW21_db0201481 [Drechslerella brochopaga]